MENNQCHRCLPPFCIWNPGAYRSCDSGMFHQGQLDLLRRNVFTPGNEHIVRAPLDVRQPIRILQGQVSSVDPAILADDFVRSRRIVEIAVEVMRAAQTQDTGFAGFDLAPGFLVDDPGVAMKHRGADTRRVGEHIFERIRAGNVGIIGRASFRHPIGLADRNPLVQEGLHHGFRARRSGGGDRLQP